MQAHHCVRPARRAPPRVSERRHCARDPPRPRGPGGVAAAERPRLAVLIRLDSGPGPGPR
eukprot:108123-Hanusia_phi.AAC.5